MVAGVAGADALGGGRRVAQGGCVGDTRRCLRLLPPFRRAVVCESQVKVVAVQPARTGGCSCAVSAWHS